MKNFTQRRKVMGISFVAILIMMFVACSNNEDSVNLNLLAEQKDSRIVLNEETEAFKSSLVSMLEAKQTRALSDEQIEKMKEKSLRMFKSHGFSESEIMNLLENDNERLIFVATVFTALMEAPSTSYSILKTRSESDGDTTCYDANSISDCLLRATGIKELLTGCLTKAAAFKVLAKIAAKIAPGVGYAVMAADFANCMGWVNWW